MSLSTEQLNMIESKEFNQVGEPITYVKPAYGYYLVYGIKSVERDLLISVRQVYFQYLKQAKQFVADALTTDHQVISLVRGKAVPYRIESRLTV